MGRPTNHDLERAAELMRTRWPADALERLRALPANERAVLVELAAYCDAVPVDEHTLEPLLDRERRLVAERRQAEARMRHGGRRTGPPPEWLELGERLGVNPAT